MKKLWKNNCIYASIYTRLLSSKENPPSLTRDNQILFNVFHIKYTSIKKKKKTIIRVRKFDIPGGKIAEKRIISAQYNIYE